MKIGAQDKTPATGYDSAHYLMAWYTAWGGGIGASWAWKIGCSHAHFGYQNPFQGWVSATQSDFAPKSSNGKKETGQQATRDSLKFYQWLQSAEGGIAGGATNSWNGRYEKYLLVRQRSMVWHMFRILYTLTRVVTSGSDSRHGQCSV